MDLYPKNEEPIAYLAFKRVNIYYKDTYYIFMGTEKKLHTSMHALKQCVDPNDMLDDTPFDTFCSGCCIINSESCPNKNGDYCECHWEHITFDSQEEFNIYKDYIYEYASRDAYYSYSLINDISNLTISTL
jgi:hypothetical protein